MARLRLTLKDLGRIGDGSRGPTSYFRPPTKIGRPPHAAQVVSTCRHTYAPVDTMQRAMRLIKKVGHLMQKAAIVLLGTGIKPSIRHGGQKTNRHFNRRFAAATLLPSCNKKVSKVTPIVSAKETTGVSFSVTSSPIGHGDLEVSPLEVNARREGFRSLLAA